MTTAAPDLHGVDARVARAARAVERDRALLATREGRETARERDPLDGVRDVAGQTTFQALRALEPGASEAAHREALLRWTHELLQARVARDLAIDEADARYALDPSLPRRVADELRRAPDDAAPGPHVLASFEEARRALVAAPAPALADVAFGRLAALAPPVTAVRRELRARRFEASRRLGLEHPWALATSASVRDLEALARALLDATEPLARELDGRLRRARTNVAWPVQVIEDGFARDAREGWPARLGPRWLEEVFGAIARRPPRIEALPSALGGASFLRAAASWGAALRLAGVARTLPFALARDPYPVDAFVFGGALAVAVAGAPFAKRRLGLVARAADAHARALVRALFRSARALAAELLAGSAESARADMLEELGSRAFGAPLPAELASAWSFGGLSGRTCVDAPARLVGAVRAHAFTRDLVDRFDEDWFDNPRAGAHLAGIAAGPVWSGEVPDLAAVGPLARAFEEAIG